MKTPSHMLVGYIVNRLMPGNDVHRRKWIIIGAVMPDIPLIIICAYYWVSTQISAENIGFVALVDQFYFNNKIFITLHNLFHAPLSLIILFAAWYLWGRGPWFYWLLIGALSHSIVDFFTHARDGYLLYWPFNWSFRYDAGINQWDMDGSGWTLLVIELTFCIGFLIIRTWLTIRPYLFYFRMGCPI